MSSVTFDPSPALMAELLTRTRTIHLFAGALDGTLTQFNAAAAESLGVPAGEPLGQPIWAYLLEPDQAALRARLASGRGRHTELRLSFVGASQHPHLLECVLEVGDGFTLLGESPPSQKNALQDELLRLNAELFVHARESARTKVELKIALAELQRSHWHVKKLQDVLPMCLECGKVRMADASWATPRTFLQKSADFLSHGYCPVCGPVVKARYLAEEE